MARPLPKVVLGAGTVIHRGGRLLVLKRAEEPNRGLWAFPGGKVEVGETPMQAAVRETKEEAGIDVEIQGIFDVVTYKPWELGTGNRWQLVVVNYLAKPNRGRVSLNAESSDYRWVLPDELMGLDTTPQMRGCAEKFARLRTTPGCFGPLGDVSGRTTSPCCR
ncbi:MAG: NUDIX domain-containing protein [Nitrososphaerota archaeon]|nr:NUDIX domain-containing protein [Nitrososphaerota archaeon]MDG6941742.1 NUDIX domain-containing protein [Nitrososphaerota archaeon]MDG6947085.1 NUDIX domain-containing protein [Nitrososphaerota archaeon]MDG6951366.1 NUDIX domain-containing protein [Nitrososphaerota archaeon]